MDITTITDLTELKAMAYDQLAIIEQCQRNLGAINQRITEVQGMLDKVPDAVDSDHDYLINDPGGYLKKYEGPHSDLKA